MNTSSTINGNIVSGKVRPYFTVFTPTYNRADILPVLYESLLLQTYQNFEWLIVDGGNDKTPLMAQEWSKAANFPIRYVRQSTIGLHGAYNEGAVFASGGLFLTIHSDDSCMPETLASLKTHWEQIPVSERNKYSGIWARCMDQTGKMIGKSLGVAWLDSTYQEMVFKRGMSEEMFPLVRTDVMREFPFPMLDGVRFVPEGLIWRAIGAKYKTRFIDVPLRKYYVLDVVNIDSGKLTSPVILRKNALSIALYDRMILMHDFVWIKYAPLRFLRLAASYIRYSLHAKTHLIEQVHGLPLTARMIWIIALPFGVAKYLRDKF
ncbi:MAG: glycosyltransferase family 2 protein [Kiritimatiellae bacterium]|nr:glycosyltransferase family 2 protein [Kiritimatiellia bacterium]MDD5521803.1 glycosyltransferase family 2 protein [Kiritimatiellia bacterium]